MTWIRNAWYVAAWDYEISDAPLARTLLGVPVMLYRKLDGGVVARWKAQQLSIAANPDKQLQAYAIDQGGIRARQMIERIRKAEEPKP